MKALSLTDAMQTMTTTLEKLYQEARQPVPASIVASSKRLSEWCDDYYTQSPSAELTEIALSTAVFVFDHAMERVCLAYAISTPQLMKRNTSRMRGFPDVNAAVQKTLGPGAFAADRGHFVGHASGGDLDINLFPHRRNLNRGWSNEGKRFREMESYATKHLGTLFYHGAMYDDETWIPAVLEYGVLREDGSWWIERFRNKTQES